MTLANHPVPAPLPSDPESPAADAAPELTILLPCLNEAATLAGCIDQARRCLDELGIDAEILVADNGSTDDSPDVATRAGARVVHVPARGYGSAILGGIAAARGRYIIMGDADGSYDFAHLAPFIDQLRGGCDLVVGNRFAGGIAPGAMPWLHRYLGNPVLSGLGRLFFGGPCRDFHCGLRGFDRPAINRLRLGAAGMELASEMIVRAAQSGLRIAEVPTALRRDGRDRPSHLRPWRDGWRHLRCLLLARLRTLPRLRRRPGRKHRGGAAPLGAGRPRPAFTLIELLVVLGIVTVLLSILLPVVSRARKQARDVACLSNLRQLASAFVFYIDDNHDRSIAFTFRRDESWVRAFREHSGVPEKVYFCPLVGEDASPGFGAALASWTLPLDLPGGRTEIRGGYGFNAWLLRWENVGKGGEEFSGGPQSRYLLPWSRGGDAIPVFADSTWVDGWPRADDPTPPNLADGDSRRQGPFLAPRENMLARFTIARHGRAINAVFLDGHAQRVPLEGLKRLKWHEAFKYRDWDPPLPAQ